MIKVMIERRVPAELLEHYHELATRLMQETMAQPGFISGESLRDMNHPTRRFIFSSWRSVQDWQRWYSSEQRAEHLAELRALLEDDEHVTLLEHP